MIVYMLFLPRFALLQYISKESVDEVFEKCSTLNSFN